MTIALRQPISVTAATMWSAIKSAFGKRSSQPSDALDRRLQRIGLESGGEQRDDGKVQAGWAVTRGRRSYNEDTIVCQFLPLPNGEKEGTTAQVACLGVFDGHGGAAASAYVRDHLFPSVLKHDQFHTNPFKALEDSYVATDAAYLALDEVHRNDDGCTATTAVLLGRQLVMAHVGDSRAVLGEGGIATPLTVDHKPNRPDERKRVESVGGTVVHAGVWRVGGMLAVSRAFGNRMLKQYVVAHPEVREDSLSARTDCLILASDGVWDVMSNLEAVEVVSQHKDAKQAATALAVLAYDRGSHDNISAVVCLFKYNNKDEPPLPARRSEDTFVWSAEEEEEHRQNGGPGKEAVAVSDTARPQSSK